MQLWRMLENRKFKISRTASSDENGEEDNEADLKYKIW